MILYHIKTNLPTTFFIPTIFGKNVAFIKTLVRLMVEFCRFWLHNWLLTIQLSVWKLNKTKQSVVFCTEKIPFLASKTKNSIKVAKKIMPSRILPYAKHFVAAWKPRKYSGEVLTSALLSPAYIAQMLFNFWFQETVCSNTKIHDACYILGILVVFRYI